MRVIFLSLPEQVFQGRMCTGKRVDGLQSALKGHRVGCFFRRKFSGSR